MNILVYHLSLVCGSVWGKVLCARMEDQLGVERDCFGAGNRRGLTVCLLPHPREKFSSGRRCCRAGLVPWAQGGWDGRQGGKCNFQKGHGGIISCNCLWWTHDSVLLQIPDGINQSLRLEGEKLDVCRFCRLLRVLEARGAVKLSSTLRM